MSNCSKSNIFKEQKTDLSAEWGSKYEIKIAKQALTYVELIFKRLFFLINVYSW